MGDLYLDAQIDHGDTRHNESLSGLVFVWDLKLGFSKGNLRNASMPSIQQPRG